MDPRRENELWLTRRQLFGKARLGIGTAALASLARGATTRTGSGRGRQRAFLLHHDRITPFVIFDARHESAHQHQAAARRHIQAIGIGRIGHVAGFETWTFIANLNPQPVV